MPEIWFAGSIPAGCAKMIRRKRLDHLPTGCCPGKVEIPETQNPWRKNAKMIKVELEASESIIEEIINRYVDRTTLIKDINGKTLRITIN